jgi:hypothetical protein
MENVIYSISVISHSSVFSNYSCVFKYISYNNFTTILKIVQGLFCFSANYMV